MTAFRCRQQHLVGEWNETHEVGTPSGTGRIVKWQAVPCPQVPGQRLIVEVDGKTGRPIGFVADDVADLVAVAPGMARVLQNYADDMVTACQVARAAGDVAQYQRFLLSAGKALSLLVAAQGGQAVAR